ncbi:MAG: hypothetical protein K1X75_07795 [Leptospirales bacterium]|nr:hypothetical protein [Leptospirales bacterium]
MARTWIASLLIVAASALAGGCAFILSERHGAVRIYSSIPSQCSTTRGLKQSRVIAVQSENELREHYGLTFLVSFNDGVTPPVYGALYYNDPAENLYCMALADGRFAVFSDSAVGPRRNVMQEICYPIKECAAPR